MTLTVGIDASRAFAEERTGTEEYSYQLIKHILRLPESIGYKFVLYVRPNTYIPDEFRQNNAVIRPINFRYLWTQVGLALVTWTDSLDLLFVPAHTLPVFRRPTLKTVVTIHGLEYKWLKEYRNLLQRWYLPLSTYYAARSATRVIAVSRATARDLVKETHISNKLIKVIHEGVEPRKPQTLGKGALDKVLARYGLKRGKYLVFVGSVQPRKNIPALVEAFSLLDTRFYEYKLVIVGGLGWSCEESLASATKHGAPDSVVYTGYVTNEVKRALIEGASLYIQPSFLEGFGLPVLEAMAERVPVIVSSGGALPEVVNQAGIVVKLGRDFTAGLASAVELLLTNSQLRGRLVAKGIKRAKELSWERSASSTMRLFYRVLEGK